MKKVFAVVMVSMMVIGFVGSASAELQPPKRGVPNPSIELVGWKLKLRP